MLSWAWIAHTIEIDNLVEATGAERVGRNVPISLAMWANRYLQRHGLVDRTPERTVSLTPAGSDALAEYRLWAKRPKHRVLYDPLAAVVERTEALAAGLVPPESCWRGRKPYLAQTRRMLANPTGALPWHPMVLHRAGWPDGS